MDSTEKASQVNIIVKYYVSEILRYSKNMRGKFAQKWSINYAISIKALK